MRHRLRVLAPLATALCLSCAVGAASSSRPEAGVVVAAAAPMVEQTGWITDAAGIIPDVVEQRLAARLAKLRRRTRHEMVIVTLPTLAGRDVTEVAEGLGNAWGIGRVGEADGIVDGVVVLIAPNERLVRIATADGIRPVLPDETCRRIIGQTILPLFRKGDLAGGIEAGADALIANLEKE